MTNEQNGNNGRLFDVSELGLECDNPKCRHGGIVKELPFWPRTAKPVVCMPCKREIDSIRRPDLRRREFVITSKGWEDGVVEFEGKKVKTRLLRTKDGKVVVPGSRLYQPDLGISPPLRYVHGIKFVYAIPENPHSDCPTQWLKGADAPSRFVTLIFKQYELQNRQSVIRAFIGLIEVRLNPRFIDNVELGQPYHCHTSVRGAFLEARPITRLVVDTNSASGLVLAAESRLEEERLLGLTGVWHHAKIYQEPGIDPEEFDPMTGKRFLERSLYISKAEVKDCFELISEVSRMDVNRISSPSEIKRAYRAAVYNCSEDRLEAVYTRRGYEIPYAARYRNKVRMIELNKACEKALNVHEMLVLQAVGDFVEKTIRAGKTEETTLLSIVRKMIVDVSNLKIFVFDHRVALPEDRDQALTYVAKHIVDSMAMDIYNVSSVETSSDEQGDDNDFNSAELLH